MYTNGAYAVIFGQTESVQSAMICNWSSEWKTCSLHLPSPGRDWQLQSWDSGSEGFLYFEPRADFFAAGFQFSWRWDYLETERDHNGATANPRHWDQNPTPLNKRNSPGEGGRGWFVRISHWLVNNLSIILTLAPISMKSRHRQNIWKCLKWYRIHVWHCF